LSWHQKGRSFSESSLDELQGGVVEDGRVTMADVDIRAALDRHWMASASGDQVAEHEIYQEDVLVEYPQSGERIRGRQNILALRSHHPSKPVGFVVRRIVGSGELWITEYSISYEGHPIHTVSIMEFQGGKVAHETQYFAEPFAAPAWRKQWVERST
jgi:hypothetical protein